MKLLDGKMVSTVLKDALQTRIHTLKQHNIEPSLGVILVGDRVESKTYVRMKNRSCEQLGISCVVKRFDIGVDEATLLQEIRDFNTNDDIHGILVQLPLPKHINRNRVLGSVSFTKDVDGFHPVNAGKLSQNDCPLFMPCTPRGCMELLKYYNIDVSGKNVTIIGCSNLVGLPLSLMMLHQHATVTICNSLTKDTRAMVQMADIVVACCGCAHLVGQDWVKDGAVIVDVGINRVDDATKKRGYRLVGDVDFDAVKEKVDFITPVPGGIGPMTIAMLMTQLVEAAEQQLQIDEKQELCN